LANGIRVDLNFTRMTGNDKIPALGPQLRFMAPILPSTIYTYLKDFLTNMCKKVTNL
jgi:hypothetical protein